MRSISQELKIKKTLAKYGAQFAYLFGSRATGKGKIAASDYDIAVFFGAGTPQSRFATRLRLIGELQDILSPALVDLVVVDDTRSVTLRYEIVNTGYLIYEKEEGSHIEFEFNITREYEDFAPFLRAYNQMYIKHAI